MGFYVASANSFPLTLNNTGNTIIKNTDNDVGVSCPVPKQLVFSSLRHPKIQKDIQPVLKRAYKRLGIEVDFVVTSSYRDLLLVSENKLMGSAAFAEDIIDTVPNVLPVYPPLTAMSYVLLCQKGVVCDSSIFNNSDNPEAIVVSTAMSKGLKDHYPQIRDDRLTTTNEVKNVIRYLKENRVNYGIYPISDKTKGGLKEIPPNVNYSILYDLQTFHVISKQISCLLPKIEFALREELHKFK
ncbi:hypothetical protein [Psychrosphaera aestuarii]|uniref:hypothetical protein n=1 Tax=Psychrosphaera aestuarii TaxID=1266052 RepID=UPI001B32D9E2|nr:hypothetical protein [Psychrosphaera aestuarii]